MFTQKKGRGEINLDEPTFYVRYAGKTETFVASGKGCTHNAVQRIWDNSVEEKHMRRMSIFINETGMLLKEMDGPKQEPVKIDIKDISYCCAEKGAHDRVFAWISKDKGFKKLFCHGVLCQNRDKAQMMAIMLSQAFQVAYRDWKMRRERLTRQRSGSGAGKHADRSEQAVGPDMVSAGCQASISSRTPARSQQFAPTNAEVSSISSPSSPIQEPHSGVQWASGDVEEMPAFAHAMEQMNIVEENEISFHDTAITIESKN